MFSRPLSGINTLHRVRVNHWVALVAYKFFFFHIAHLYLPLFVYLFIRLSTWANAIK